MVMYKDSDSPGRKIATRVLMPLSCMYICKSFLLPPPFLSLLDNISKASIIMVLFAILNSSADFEASISISRCPESHRDPKPCL